MKIFISYSWDSEEHRRWVRSVAELLIANGYDVIMDSLIDIGDDLTGFIENAFIKADKVMVIMTENYHERSGRPETGVGFEYRIIRDEIRQGRNRCIPVLCKDHPGKTSVPYTLQHLKYVNLREVDIASPGFQELIQHLERAKKQLEAGIPSPPPPPPPPPPIADDDKTNRIDITDGGKGIEEPTTKFRKSKYLTIGAVAVIIIAAVISWINIPQSGDATPNNNSGPISDTIVQQETEPNIVSPVENPVTTDYEGEDKKKAGSPANTKPESKPVSIIPLSCPDAIGSRYTSKGNINGDYLMILSRNGNTVDFTGELGAYSISGQAMVKNGNMFTTISNPMIKAGGMIKLNGCQEVTVSMQVRESEYEDFQGKTLTFYLNN